MSHIRFHNVSKDYDGRPVLRRLFFRLNSSERVGLIGKNGAGKTTILRLILGQEEPSEGSVEIDPGVSIGYFSQFSELNGEQTVLQVLDELFAPIHALESALLEVEVEIEEAAASGRPMDSLMTRQAGLLDAMQHQDGWNYTNKIDTVLTRLGFNHTHRHLPIGQLSGGWRNRAALAKILLQAPDILLMDEPTNYLDLEGLMWLEEWINNYRGALLLVSHDRHFLDRVVQTIWEVQNYNIQEYQGGFSQYVREKPLRMKNLERQFEHEEELLALESEAISDRQDALKNPSQHLKRKLANIKKESKPRLVEKIVSDIYRNLYTPTDVLQVEHLHKAYEQRSLFQNIGFDLHKGERLAIIGPNGCGKSTLLRVMLEEEAPDSGRVAWAKSGAHISFNQIFADLDLNDTVSHAVNITDLAFFESRKSVNRFLGLMQFSELDLNQRIGTLSGGQRARIALAKALFSGASCIVLDEPTNHLDLTSTQVMEAALLHFPGAVIVASHDRFFIDKIATRLLIFDGQGHIEPVWGNWSTWQASR
jgi:ATPase subunit of ABC transporter with duplicated ATPase domains